MKKETKVYVGMDVHKDSVMMAVLPEGAREPTLVKRLSHDPRGIRRLLDRLARKHEVRVDLSVPASARRRAEATPGGPAGRGKIRPAGVFGNELNWEYTETPAVEDGDGDGQDAR